MKIIVIGAVAAGTSAAAKASRNDPGARITVYEKGEEISYAGCILPYYVGGIAGELSSLTPRDSAFFKRRYGVDVLTRHEVTAIDRENRRVKVRSLDTGNVFEDSYDRLIIATGAKPAGLSVAGSDAEHVFSLRNVRDAAAIKDFIDKRKPKTAVIIGSGPMGLEMLENLKGIDVCVVESAGHIVPALDADMAEFLEGSLRDRGVKILTSRRVDRISEAGVTLDGAQVLDAEMVLITAGVVPDTGLAAAAGIETGIKGAIKVDGSMRTNDEYIYACGDCAETFSAITGRPAYFPLGSTANKTGRIAGDAATGGDLRYRGSLGTGIFKVFGLTAGYTGLNERDAREQGFDAVSARISAEDKSAVFGGRPMEIKAVAQRKTGRLLGAQIIGYGGVDKRIDVFAAMITFGAKAQDLENLDLCYSPPYSTARDPVHIAGMVLSDALR